MGEHSKDYHSYVFRDGKLLGDFEAMYRHSEEVPWHQDRQEDWIDVHLTVEMRGHLGSRECRAYGYDISETACAKARSLFPDYSFSRLDLTAGPVAARPPAHSASAANRLFIIRGTLWYVFPKLT